MAFFPDRITRYHWQEPDPHDDPTLFRPRLWQRLPPSPRKRRFLAAEDKPVRPAPDLSWVTTEPAESRPRWSLVVFIVVAVLGWSAAMVTLGAVMF